MVRLDEEINLSKTKKHTIEVIIDRVVVNEDNKERVAEDIEKALKESFGEVKIEVLNHEELGVKKGLHFSEHLACFNCKLSFEPLEPLSFSFNSPKGACSSCDGLGIRYVLDLKKIIDENKTIAEGAVKIMYGLIGDIIARMLNWLTALKNFLFPKLGLFPIIKNFRKEGYSKKRGQIPFNWGEGLEEEVNLFKIGAEEG